ncbi:MAG: holo-ACP synthase [Chloroflexota bacterium]
MTDYTGIDIIEIDRINRAVDRWGEPFLRRIYTGPELDLCRHKPPSLAARFACKEAVMKLLGTGTKGVKWRDIETVSLPGGRPVLNLYGQARREADRLGLESIAVSLTHSKEYAIASVSGTARAR